MIESTDKVLKIVAAYFAPSNGIEEIAENGNQATVTFYNGYAWEQIKFSECAYEEPAGENDNGTVYNQKLSMVLAGDDETIQERLLEIETAKPVFRFDYDNGVSKIMGDKENYCRFLHGGSSEEFITKNDITITRTSAYKAFFLQ